MTDTHKRLITTISEIENIDKRIVYLTEKRKKLMDKRKKLEEEELLEVVRHNGADVNMLNDDLSLGKLLRENNISTDDIMDFIINQNKNKPEDTEE